MYRKLSNKNISETGIRQLHTMITEKQSPDWSELGLQGDFKTLRQQVYTFSKLLKRGKRKHKREGYNNILRDR